jgi:hypothetical protein
MQYAAPSTNLVKTPTAKLGNGVSSVISSICLPASKLRCGLLLLFLQLVLLQPSLSLSLGQLATQPKKASANWSYK